MNLIRRHFLKSLMVGMLLSTSTAHVAAVDGRPRALRSGRAMIPSSASSCDFVYRVNARPYETVDNIKVLTSTRALENEVEVSDTTHLPMNAASRASFALMY